MPSTSVAATPAAITSQAIAPSATPAALASGPPAKRIRIALTTDSGPLGPLSNATPTFGGPQTDFQKAAVIDHFIYAALYRFDAQLRPIPDLASNCSPDAAGTTITCMLIDARFQNGERITAEDVVQSYRLVAADASADSPFGDKCIAAMLATLTGCPADVLVGVSKVDDATVAFQLSRPYAPFFTLVLPTVWIESTKIVNDAHAAFLAKAAQADPSKLQAAANDLAGAILTPSGDCSPFLQDAAQLVARVGLRVPDRAEFNTLPGGGFNACGLAGYGAALALELAQAAASVQSTGDRAKALAYQWLPFNRAPMGAGPYRLTALEPGKRVLIAAEPGFHGTAPATPEIEFLWYADDDAATEAVAAGHADWAETYFSSPSGVQTGSHLHIGVTPSPTITMLLYNVRAGQLFADLSLRKAVRLCIDKSAMVKAAAAAGGIPIESDLAPGWWGFEPDLAPPIRDVAKAKALIEASGWRLGADGIYAKGGKRLEATVYVRTDAADRVYFANTLRLLVRECGMALAPNQDDFGGSLGSIFEWPNTGPGTTQPFDLYLLGWSNGVDPIPVQFASANIGSKEHPQGLNAGGFSDPRIDDLIARLTRSYDLAEREALYHEYQALIADKQPALFGWDNGRLVVLAGGLMTVDGPIDIDDMYWAWAPERLMLRSTGP